MLDPVAGVEAHGDPDRTSRQGQGDVGVDVLDGKVSAARRPVYGPDKVGRLLLGLMRGVSGFPEARADLATYNNAPALVLYLGEKLEGVILIEVEDGKISHFYAMRNPDKLGGVLVERSIQR